MRIVRYDPHITTSSVSSLSGHWRDLARSLSGQSGKVLCLFQADLFVVVGIVSDLHQLREFGPISGLVYRVAESHMYTPGCCM